MPVLPGNLHPGTNRRGRTVASLSLVVAIAVVLAIAAFDGFTRPLWLDEAFSLTTSGGTLKEAWTRSLVFEMQPPAYFLLLWGWLKVSDTVGFARLLSAVCAALALWIAHRTDLELNARGESPSLPWLLALCPHFLWAAAEARVYAMAILFSSATTLLFLRVWVSGKPTLRRDLLLWLLSAYLSLLTFYYCGFVLLGQFAAGWISKRRRRELVLVFSALAVLMLPWAPTVFRQVVGHPVYLSPVLVPAGPAAERLLYWARWAIGNVIEAIFRPSPLIYRSDVTWLALLLGTAVTAAAFLFARRRPGRTEGALAVIALAPCAVLIALRATNVAVVEARHLLVIVPAILALLVALLRAARRPWPGVTLSLAVVALLTATVVGSVTRNRVAEDWPAAAEHVRQRAESGEPIVLFMREAALPFRRYYRGVNPVIGLPSDAEPDRPFSMVESSVRDARQIRDRLISALGKGRSCWLVELRRLRDPLGGAVLDEFERRELDVLSSNEFRGVRVRHIRLRKLEEPER